MTETRDKLNRPLRDLRISVTDRCNLRCTYCMPEEEFDATHLTPRDAILSFEEIARITTIAARLGVTKLRLTGGEPLLRRGLSDLVAMLGQIEGIQDIALTTNGILLPRYAEALKQAGLNRITVSLDSLDDTVLAKMNGAGAKAAPVLRGIEAAVNAGLAPVKINVVVHKGVNDHTLVDLVRHFKDTPCILRFIEYMDVGTMNQWDLTHVLPSFDLLQKIDRVFPLKSLDANYHGEVASRYGFKDVTGEIGLISSVSRPFCRECTRLRLSSDGRLFTCLFGEDGLDIRTPMRRGATDEALMELMTGQWREREDRYSELRATGQAPALNKVEMYRIGG